MRKDELRIFEELLVCIGQQSESLPQNDRLTGFFGMKGNNASGELMVIGRAVNEWSDGWLPADCMSNEIRMSIAIETMESVEGPSPMLWVSESWGNESGYNTKRSAFWRVINTITDKLGIANIENKEWPSYLIWSNLYKIAPEAGGNPSEQLCDIQFGNCVKLLQQEITQWKPKRILMLTGINWAMPFIEELGLKFNKSETTDYVDGSFSTTLNGNPLTVVVAKHPQGKNETLLVNEVVAEFNKHCHQ